jgi:hypothetical protein
MWKYFIKIYKFKVYKEGITWESYKRRLKIVQYLACIF